MILPKAILEEIGKASVDAGQYTSAEELAEALADQLCSVDALETLRDAMLRRQLELADERGGEHPAEEVFDNLLARLRAMKTDA